MKALKQRLTALWAQSHGVRWDVVAGRLATGLGVIGGLSQYAGWIPGRTGATIAVVCVVCAGASPKVTKAAGLLKTAYGQQTPLLKVLPAIVSTLLAGPSIVAQAKAAEADEARAQAKAADDKRITQKVQDELVRMGITQGVSRTDMSQDVPADLKAALAPTAQQEAAAEESPTLTASVRVEDKVPSTTENQPPIEAAAEEPVTGEAAVEDTAGGNTL